MSYIASNPEPIIVDIIVQQRQVKNCLGCQIKSLDRDQVERRHIPMHEVRYNPELLNKREDILSWWEGEHQYGVAHKIGIWVTHCFNHSDCYNYRLVNIQTLFEEGLSNNLLQEVKQLKLHVCPGHVKFIDRYAFASKAQSVGVQKVNEMQLNPNIQEATYSIIDKNSPIGKISEYFNSWLSFRYAVVLHYKHFDTSIECPNHPKYVSDPIKHPFL